MRSLFGVVGLLVVVVVMGWLAKSQLPGRATPVPTLPVSVPSDGPSVPSGSPAAIPQQYRQALEGALQPPPPPQDP